ncbi:HNH endonuclease [Psychrobacter phage D'Alembert]|nr:HNH endonuclease [Psychrobacter phage D'Alembert]
MTRGYCPKFKDKHPTYKDCTVCETWHNFQVFAKWVKEHKFNLDGYQLDKDLLIKGNKKYSAETCTLVPRAINTLFNDSAAIRGKFAQGVGWHKSKGKLRAYVKRRGKHIHLGYFETEEEASLAAKRGKEEYVKEVVLEWEGRIEDRLFNTLMNWKLT